MTPLQKILIVDDRVENLVALRQVLQDVTAEVIAATSGNEALAATLDHKFALAILDVMMPGMSGFELAQHLRGDDKTRLMPTIFVTAAYPDEQRVFSGYDAGAVDYIVKPYRPEILLAKVRVFLALDRQRQELQWQRDHLEMLVAERTAALANELAVRKQTEERLRQKNEELERFTYTVSHELKSPVVTIKNFLTMLENDFNANDLEWIARDFNHMHHAADRMEQLIDELLTLTRMGVVVNSPEEIAFKSVIEKAMTMVAGAIAARKVEVAVTCADVHLRVDLGRMIELLQNLIENAVKYMGEQDMPRIEIGSKATSDGPIFYVRDNGIGIESQYHDRIFNLFEKLDMNSPGAGAGLALVKRIVGINGGRIWVESEGCGKGSCFYFTLPAAVMEADA